MASESSALERGRAVPKERGDRVKEENLGLFDRKDDDTGSVNVDELRSALSKAAAGPPRPPPAVSPTVARRQAARARREALARRHKRRRRHTLVALAVLLVLAAAITTGLLIWRHNSRQIPDFSGTPGAELIIRVHSGDTRDVIAQTLTDAGVVASAQAFLNNTVNDGDVAKVQPGYYKLRAHLSAAAAADALVDPAARVGQLRLIPGRQLADVSTRSGGAGTVVPGYISAITKAACVPLNGTSHCFTTDDLWKVADTADPVALGVVDWAVDSIAQAPDPHRRLEGMIVPGDVDVPPNATPMQALQAVISASAASWNTSDIVAASASVGLTPYQAAVVASLVEREGNTTDMGKVARVIDNRIENRMPLQLDSTVNYALNRAQIATTKADRANRSAYNTYAHAGLPPTPISSPGVQAVDATLTPETGDWLYFVKVDKQGNSCFSATLPEHEACVATARKNGVFDG